VSDDPVEQAGRTVGRGGLALMLPMAMAVTPIVGYFAGKWIGEKIGWGGMAYVGLGLGIIGGIRESLNIFRRLAEPPPRSASKPNNPEDPPPT